jgi:hypothetical protein
MTYFAGADDGRSDRDVDAILAGVDDPEDYSAGLDIEIAGADYSAGLDIEMAGADYSAGEDDVEAAADVVSGAMSRGVPAKQALSRLPVSLRGPVVNAIRRRQQRASRNAAIARKQPVLRDPGPKNWLETEEGFGPITVTAGATSSDIIIQPDVLAFRPISLFVADEIASYFRLTYFYAGRHNALMGSGKIPCSRFKSTATVKKWRLPTIRNGGRMILRFENKDAADHAIEGSIAGLMIE